MKHLAVVLSAKPCKWLLGIYLALSPVLASANLSVNIRLDTSSLLTLTGPHFLDFQLYNADGINPNNTVTLSEFNFGTGGAKDAPITYCAASDFLTGVCTPEVMGNLASPQEIITFKDYDAQYYGFSQEFMPGNYLSFNVNMTLNSSGSTPDAFNFTLTNLGPDLNQYYFGFFEFALDPDSQVLPSQDFEILDFYDNRLLSLSAEVTRLLPPASAVPEPATWGLLAGGVLLLGWQRRLLGWQPHQLVNS